MPQVSGTKKYALVVDSKFASEFRFPSIGTEDVERTTAILQSNPKIVITPESPFNNVNKYNLIINNEVVGSINYINDGDFQPDPKMINAALQSDPTFVDITGLNTPEVGDVWDGTNFISQES